MSEPPKEPLPFAAGDNEAGLLKQSQMAGDHGGIKPKHPRKLAAAALSFSEDSKDPHPGLVGQSLAQSHQILGNFSYCIVGHKCKITWFPLETQDPAEQLKNRQALGPKWRDQPIWAVTDPPILKPTH